MTMLWKRTFFPYFAVFFWARLSERMPFPDLFQFYSSFPSHRQLSNPKTHAVSLWTFGVEKMPNMCMEISANTPTKSMKAKKRCQMSSKLENMSIISWHEWHDQAVDYIAYTPSNSQPFFMWYSCLLLFFFLGLAKTKQWPAFMLMSWMRWFGLYILPLKKNWWVELRSAHSFCQEPFSTI